MADNITDNSSSQDTSVQLGNMSVEIDQQIDILSKAEELVRKGLARLRSLQTRDAPITDEPCPKRNKEAPNVVGELKRYFIEEEKKHATARKDSISKNDPKSWHDGNPIRKGSVLHKELKVYIAARQKARRNRDELGGLPDGPDLNLSMSTALDNIATAAGEKLRQTVLRFLDAHDILSDGGNKFFPEYRISYKLHSSEVKDAYIDCVVHVRSTNELHVYDWKFFNKESANNASSNNKQVQEYVELVSQETGLNVSGYLVVFCTEKPKEDPTIILINRMGENKRANYKFEPQPVSATKVQLPRAQT